MKARGKDRYIAPARDQRIQRSPRLLHLDLIICGRLALTCALGDFALAETRNPNLETVLQRLRVDACGLLELLLAYDQQ